jgi:hypothetical protein
MTLNCSLFTSQLPTAMTTEKTFASNLGILAALMLQTVQQNVHVCMSPIPKGSTVSLPQYACGQTTNASSQTTAATWRRTNVCPIYSRHIY